MQRLLASAALLVGGWVAMTGTASATPDGHTVMLIGDSIAQSITDEVKADLAEQGWDTVALGVGGTGLTHGSPAWQLGATFDWQTQLASMESDYDPDVLLIVLGINDVFSVAEGEDYTQHVARLLSVTDAPVVEWADVASHTGDPIRNAGAATIDAALAAEVREGFTVPPYDETISTVPEDLDVDGLHLSGAGQAAFSELFASTTGTAPESGTAPK